MPMDKEKSKGRKCGSSGKSAFLAGEKPRVQIPVPPKIITIIIHTHMYIN
jgi:hypothetical protein